MADAGAPEWAQAPAYDSSMTPQAYFGVVKGLYPNAEFNGGGRTAEHNAAIGGAPNSMHLTNQALDFAVPGVPAAQVEARLKSAGLPVTEFLNENANSEYSTGPHLHVGWRPLSGPVNNTPAWAAPQTAQPTSAPAWASAPTPSGAPSWAQPPAPHPQPQQQPQGATGFDMIGQTIGDFMNPGAPNHAPNALEQGIMGVSQTPLVRGLHGSYMQAVTNGPVIQPVRMAMEGLGVGRQPGESDAAFHQRYTDAVNAARAQANQEVQQSGAYDQSNIPTWARGAERFGQQALNVGANVAANPWYFAFPASADAIIPGGALARVAGAGAVNAGVANLSDTAAQSMDLLTGQKKKFDVEQNLQQTLTGGLFGAAAHGAEIGGPVISDFVKGLFNNRGVDTTPPSDPRAQLTSPLTRDSVQLNATEAQQYQQLLRTGDVDDIKNFFKGRNGPQPSYEDVNNWVNHRDLAPENVNDTHLQPDFNYENEYNRQLVEQHVQATTAGWKNAPNFEVVHGPEDIQDPQIRAQAQAEDPNGTALGFLGNDGKARIYSGRVTDPDVASAVVYHEGLGHFGLAQKFGDQLDDVINTLLAKNVSQFSKQVDAWQAKNPGAYGGDRTRAGEEVLAVASQNGQIKPSWYNAVASTVRNFGRKMGMDLAYSPAEVNHILAMAHDAVINGQPDVASNGFRGATQGPNKFMFTGEHAQGFDPHDQSAYMAKDQRVRNEIDDRNAIFTSSPHYPGEDPKVPITANLPDMLNHPDLYHAYPQLRGMRVDSFDLGDKNLAGGYDEDQRRIVLNNTLSEDVQRTTLLHEVQHAIQHIEQYPDFVSAAEAGGTERLNNDDYTNHPSELEARATEGRRDLSPEERNASPPRFMRMSDMAASPNYKADDLEGIYKALDENYTPTGRSWEEDRAQALSMGFKPSQMKGLSALNPGDLSVRLYRYQAAANLADMKISDLNRRLDTPDWSVKDQADYIQTLAERDWLVQRIKGDKSEIARALNVAKAASSYTNSTMEQVAELLRSHGSGLASLAEDPTAFLKFAKQVKEVMGDPGPNGGPPINPDGAHVLMEGVTKPYWEQYLTTVHMNMMLSALSTHVKAPVDMATGITRNILEKAMSIPVGAARTMLRNTFGMEAKPGVELAELQNHMFGVLQAVSDAEVYRRVAIAAKTGESSYVVGGEATPTNFANQFGATSNPHIPILSKPTDLISAQDTFFRSVEMNAQLNSLGARQARIELGPDASNDDIRTMGRHLALNPSDAMVKEAYDLTNRTLLLNPNPLNKTLDKLKAYRPGMDPWQRAAAFITNAFAPFIRVESNNLLNRVIQRSPLGLLDPYTLSQIKAGGAKADIAVTKMLYGTALIAMAWMGGSVAQNKLTGNGPDNVDRYKEMIAGGYSPRAVHENGQYNVADSVSMSIMPWDQHNATATMVAGARQAYDEGMKTGWPMALKLAIGATLHDLSKMTWVNDIAPIVDAVTAHGEEGANVVSGTIANEAKTWIPNIVSQYAAGGFGHNLPGAEGIQRDTTAPNSISGQVANSVQSEIPGLREQLPVKYSVYGDPLQSSLSLTGIHTMIPGLSGNHTTQTVDPAEMEMDRLNAQITGSNGAAASALVTPVQRSIQYTDGNGDKQVAHLTPPQFEEYQRLAGRGLVINLNAELNTPEFQAMNDSDRIAEVRQLETDSKSAARQAILEAFYGQ